MVWFFERDKEEIRVETRYEQDSGEYTLIIDRGAGARHTERFDGEGRFRLRLQELEQQLEGEHWTRHGPFLLRDGWKA